MNNDPFIPKEEIGYNCDIGRYHATILSGDNHRKACGLVTMLTYEANAA